MADDIESKNMKSSKDNIPKENTTKETGPAMIETNPIHSAKNDSRLTHSANIAPRLTHEFGPFFNHDSEILILGSFPSVKSREQQFYYGHPQNRFWKLLTILFCSSNFKGSSSDFAGNSSDFKGRHPVFTGSYPDPVENKMAENKMNEDLPADISDTPAAIPPNTIEEKKQFLKDHHIALWDVIESCEITGSSDQSIKNAEVNDLSLVIPGTEIDRIVLNGGLAYRLFEKHMSGQAEQLGIPPERWFKMPSTSPANAAYSLERLTEHWSKCLPESGRVLER